MEVPSLWIQGLLGFSSFQEEEHYDVEITQDYETQDDENSAQFLFIYGFISLLAFFILLSLLTVCYYHFKALINMYREVVQEENNDTRSSLEENSTPTNNISTEPNEENIVSNENVSSEILFDTSKVATSCVQSYLSRTANLEIENSVEFVNETDSLQTNFSEDVNSLFSRPNSSSIKVSEIYTSETSYRKHSKKNVQTLKKHKRRTKSSSLKNDVSRKCPQHLLSESGLSRHSPEEFDDSNNYLLEIEDSKSSLSEINVSSISSTEDDICSSSVFYSSKTSFTDTDISEAYLESINLSFSGSNSSRVSISEKGIPEQVSSPESSISKSFALKRDVRSHNLADFDISPDVSLGTVDSRPKECASNLPSECDSPIKSLTEKDGSRAYVSEVEAPALSILQDDERRESSNSDASRHSLSFDKNSSPPTSN